MSSNTKIAVSSGLRRESHTAPAWRADSDRKNARFAGILLLMGWSGVFIFPFIAVLSGADFPMNIAGSGSTLAWGALVHMFMVFSCSGIAVFLYHTLKKQSPALALWAVVLRAIEAVMGLAAATILLVIMGLGRDLAQAGPETLAALTSLGILLRSSYDLLGNVPGSLAFCLGALIYNYLFFRARLVPRWIAAWGIMGASLSIAFVILTIVGVSSASVSFIVDLSAGVQELALAFYLIIKGFRGPVGAPERA